MVKRLLLFVPILILFNACLEESTPALDKKAFTKIYDNSNFDASYYPIDMQQTPDGGYLILGGRRLEDTNFSGIYLLKADKFGNFVKDVEVSASFVNPVGKFIQLGDNYVFFCMDPLTLQTYLASVDADAENVTTQVLDASLTYPAAGGIDNTNLLLLSYDHTAKESVVSVVDATGHVTDTKGYTIGAGDQVEEPLINHFLRTGKQFPFEVGRIPGSSYYFNGFYNYTFSLSFVDLAQDDPGGIVQGQQDDGGFSALVPITTTKFAASRFNFGDNYILPNATLSTSGISSSVDLGGNSLPELESNATVKIIRATVKGKNVIVYASNTKSKQIGLYFYDETTGEFLSSQYAGYSNPFEVAAVIQTAEGDLAIAGTAYIAGRFPRFCLIKIPKSSIKL
jgi:hypothetical protein